MKQELPGIRTDNWLNQRAGWPDDGKHILANYNSDWVVVYQAYRPEIANWALEHQRFGGPWSFSRMSWIKPNFLWMMFRCGWASKPDQERVLAIKLRREAFDHILANAKNAEAPVGYSTQEWREALRDSDIRLQWDPDHEPDGTKCERRAIQLGLRGQTLRQFSDEWLVGIEDITAWVHTQRELLNNGRKAELLVPTERVYTPPPHAAENIGLSGFVPVST